VADHESTPMSKSKKLPAATRPDPNVLRKTVSVVKGETGPSDETVMAEMYLSSTAMAGSDVRRITHGKGNDGPGVTELVEQLERQTKLINSGDLSEAEAMLFAQSHTLQHLFSRLSRHAIANMEAGYGDAFDRYMRMALRAQNQCRANLETLAALKNPQVIFAKQANVSRGHQQINNYPASRAESEQSKLLQGETHESMDTRTAATPSRVNPAVEAVGTINRAA
jgi:hypothetical protein